MLCTAQIKHTPNVRKILTSQKTFANHLDDFIALQALEANATAAANSANKRAAVSAVSKRDDAVLLPDTQRPEKTYTLLTPSYRPAPTPHPGDNDALLRSRIPPFPTDEELRALLAQPTLSYGEARGNWDQDGYPIRVFCEVCGYWGRVRCMKCGARICALDCLETHREECVTRYGL